MKRWVTLDDFKDVYGKAKQRGLQFLLSKLNFNSLDRTRSAFNASWNQSANWWIIPMIRERWNLKITGDPSVEYESLLIKDYLHSRKGLQLLSLGCGDGYHEMQLASHDCFDQIVGIDIASNLIDDASAKAKELGLSNISFLRQDIYTMNLQKEFYDVILFNSSLHHFKNVEGLLVNLIKPSMKKDALIIVNEYVGPDRLQFSKTQIKEINKALTKIPDYLKTRFKSQNIKKRFYGSGVLRMIVADPSECVDSSSIIPALHKHFKIVVEKPYGGNILMNTLKDIAHHFENPTQEAEEVLGKLFEIEDEYLKAHDSDFVFGVYRKVV